MDDYITVLLNDLEDRAAGFLPGEYYAAISREAAAAEALEARQSAGPTPPETMTAPASTRMLCAGRPFCWAEPCSVRPALRTAPRCCCR